MIQFRDFEDRLVNSWTVLHDKFRNLRPYLQFASDAVLYLILETVQKLNKEKKITIVTKISVHCLYINY